MKGKEWFTRRRGGAEVSRKGAAFVSLLRGDKRSLDKEGGDAAYLTSLRLRVSA
ncbi:hypothetical protein GCM10011614_25230 [Novosphingobium colocasiae]|uniref:Uncharacterized protein n=1 Tax=Novosphingobium colocasiae TaxID=1256513 RepID=A0A918PIL2_9SPHN|nr:hypothetical protein GCM10011614_25230 [Novosphingobium colocasiae]